MVLSQKISKFSDDTFKDLFEKLFSKLIQWIEKEDNIYPITDYNTCKKKFFIFLIDNVTNGKYLNDNDYIVFKYLDDLTDLFLHMKDISSSYTSNILHEHFRTSNDLLFFIFDNCIYVEENKELDSDNFHIDELTIYFSENVTKISK